MPKESTLEERLREKHGAGALDEEWRLFVVIESIRDEITKALDFVIPDEVKPVFTLAATHRQEVIDKSEEYLKML